MLSKLKELIAKSEAPFTKDSDWSPAGHDNKFRREYTFENGYGMSVVWGGHSYGADKCLFEAAVTWQGELYYKTPVTSDVEGWLDFVEVVEMMQKVAALPRKLTYEELEARVAELEAALGPCSECGTNDHATMIENGELSPPNDYIGSNDYYADLENQIRDDIFSEGE
tara:strand:- start:87 stop:590 length:504 start_codon:yes stop_codon:yes gene_type:complete